MKRLLRVLIAVLNLVLFAFPVHGKEPVRIGVLANLGKETAVRMWTPTGDYLTTRIPQHFFTIIPLSFDEINRSVERKEVDFVLTNPGIYVELEYTYGVTRIATLDSLWNGKGYNSFGGVIFTRANRGDINELRDLKGKAFIAVHEASYGGWLAALRELKAGSIDPRRHFSRLLFSGESQEQAVFAVRDGKADAGTVRTGILEHMAEEGKISLADFKILNPQKSGGFPLLLSTRLYPEWAFGRLRHTDDLIAKKVAVALLDMPADSPAAKAGKIAGFTVPLDYQPVHQLMQELRLDQYKDYGKPTLGQALKRYWPGILLLFAITFFLGYATLYLLKLKKEMAERKRADELLGKSEERFRLLAENSRDMIYRMSLPDGRYEYVSPASTALFGYAPEEFYSSPMLIHQVIHPDWHGYFEEQWAKLLAGDMLAVYEYQIFDKSGGTKWLYQRNTLIRDAAGRPIAMQGTVIDITERKKSEERIVRLSRLYSVLSRINETIVRTHEPEELYQQACKIIVEDGLFRMSWIGIIDPETLLVNPVAICGHEDGYLKIVQISVDENVPSGRGPTGIAIRTGGYFICNDIEHDPIMAPWRDEALKRGYRSSAAFSLKSGTKIIGSLNVYSDVADFFQEEENKLKISLAEDISYAIESIEIEKQRIKAEEKLQKFSIELENRVKERTAALQDSQLALMNIVDDLNSKTEELEGANIKLKELDRLKSLFIASMSHELRTPLNSVIGFSSILLNEWLGPLTSEQKENLATILRSGKHLLTLINDVIDVSKIEAGQVESIIEEFDLYDLVSEAINLVQADAQGEKLALTFDTSRHQMRTDRRRLLQSVINLLSNAVKFTAQGGITVRARRVGSSELGVGSEEKVSELQTQNAARHEDFIEISVADTGMGIKEEDMQKLFQPFTRLVSPKQATIAGTGLGLYLTHKLVTEVLKGDILCTSTYGKGSTFTIRIPSRLA